MSSKRPPTPTVYISVDIEADGPIPGPWSMVSLGAVVAGWHDAESFRRADHTAGFYREIRPISEQWDPEALAVSGLDRATLLADGAEPAAAIRKFAAWVESMRTGPGGHRYRPVMVGYPAVYDCAYRGCSGT